MKNVKMTRRSATSKSVYLYVSATDTKDLKKTVRAAVRSVNKRFSLKRKDPVNVNVLSFKETRDEAGVTSVKVTIKMKM